MNKFYKYYFLSASMMSLSSLCLEPGYLAAQEVTVTSAWLDFYGTATSFEGEDIAPGTLIQAFDPDGILCGEFVVKTGGVYGFMPVYEDDPLTPNIDEGAQEGDQVSITINGMRAEVSDTTMPTWSKGIDKLNINIRIASATAVSDGDDKIHPEEFVLYQNYPNPFNPETEIRFQIPKAENVAISVYNTLGQEIRRLTDEHLHVGFYSVRWDGKDSRGIAVTSGVYIYKIQAGNSRQARKMSLVR